MPTLAIDGGEIFYEERGEGEPPALLTLGYLSNAGVYDGLVEGLARWRRVVTYDLRGTGRSTPQAEITAARDIADLAALAEAIGPPVALVGIGDGGPRAVRAAAAHPELVSHVLATNALGRDGVEGTSSLAASLSVAELFREQLSTDYRSALRSAIGGVNPQYSEDELRARVDATAAFSPQYATLARFDYWVGDSTLDDCRAVGPKLFEWAVGDNPFFSSESIDRTRELCPEATAEVFDHGPITDPEMVAGRIERFIAG
ncbi:MAG: alpha/beta hydrolase [Thermoleophilaceae bacterium]|nr:alpha/beta hydrolase [Thermoleophilaceae bacterium]